MKLIQTAMIISLVVYLSGCGDKGRSPAPGGNETAREIDQARIPYEFPDWEKNHRWTRERILKRHNFLAMKPLPDYVENVWGAGRNLDEYEFQNDWAFVVPKDRIGEFLDYLRDLGVPEEYMSSDSPYRVSDRENWTPPKPRATKIKFLMVETQVADGVHRGLRFVAGQSRLYCFENPNLAQSELHIRFDSVTGNAHVVEMDISSD